MTAIETVRELLSHHTQVPADDHAPLELSSFAMVVLVEELEDAFDLRIKATQVIPENFGSVAGIVALVTGGRR